MKKTPRVSYLDSGVTSASRRRPIDETRSHSISSCSLLLTSLWCPPEGYQQQQTKIQAVEVQSKEMLKRLSPSVDLTRSNLRDVHLFPSLNQLADQEMERNRSTAWQPIYLSSDYFPPDECWQTRILLIRRIFGFHVAPFQLIFSSSVAVDVVTHVIIATLTFVTRLVSGGQSTWCTEIVSPLSSLSSLLLFITSFTSSFPSSASLSSIQRLLDASQTRTKSQSFV